MVKNRGLPGEISMKQTASSMEIMGGAVFLTISKKSRIEIEDPNTL